MTQSAATRTRQRSGRGSFSWWVGLLVAASVFTVIGWSDDSPARAVGGFGLFLAIGVTIFHGHWVFGSEGRAEARIMTTALFFGLLAVVAVVLDQIVQPLSGSQLSVGLLGVCWLLAAFGILRKKPGRAAPRSPQPGGAGPRTWPWWAAVAVAAVALASSIFFAWRTEVTELTPTGPIVTSPDSGKVQLYNPTEETLRLRLELPRGVRTVTLKPGEKQTIRTTTAPGAEARVIDLSSEGSPTLRVTIGSGGA